MLGIEIQVVPGLSRNDFGELANEIDCFEAVEVGTDQGEYAGAFLENFQGILYCVDLYSQYHEMSWDREFDRLMALMHLSRYNGRVRFIRKRSIEAATYLRATSQIKFVYIDASHKFGDVLEDLEYWWNTLAPGGLLCGHDWSDWHHPVIKAVVQFALSEEIALISLTDEKDSSWILRKPSNEDSTEIQNPNSEEKPNHSDRSDDSV